MFDGKDWTCFTQRCEVAGLTTFLLQVELAREDLAGTERIRWVIDEQCADRDDARARAKHRGAPRIMEPPGGTGCTSAS